MRNSQLHVDPLVNFLFVDSDKRSNDHQPMVDIQAFKRRFNEAVRRSGAVDRSAFADLLGKSKAVISNWYSRDNHVPDKERRLFESKTGVSLDWVNDGIEPMITGGLVENSSSQSGRLNTAKLADLLETVEAAIAKSGRQVPIRTKARLVAALYGDEQASAAGSAQAVQAALTSILASLEET